MQNCSNISRTLKTYMRVVITSATVDEWMPSFLKMEELYTATSSRFKVTFHQSGVGMLSTAVSLTELIYTEKPDLIIQAGIGGTFDSSIPLGKTVVVKEDILGDMGVEEDGKWKDIFEMKLEKSSYYPFEKRKLPNPHLQKFNLLKLPEVTAISVNEISTRPEKIQQLIKKYNPFLESMEGSALHYVCRKSNTPFLQIRSISNHVGERDKENWALHLALTNLNECLIKYIEKLYKIS